MIKLLADPNMVGDRVGNYGPMGGVVGVLVVALFFYVLLDGPMGRKKK